MRRALRAVADASCWANRQVNRPFAEQASQQAARGKHASGESWQLAIMMDLQVSTSLRQRASDFFRQSGPFDFPSPVKLLALPAKAASTRESADRRVDEL